MTDKAPLPLIALIAAQSLCAAFFLFDVLSDGIELGWPPVTHWHFIVETIAAIVLIAAVAFEVRTLKSMLRREAHLEQQLSLAAGAFHDVVTQHFGKWSLTPAEQDVAMLTLKGLAIPEIARLRGNAEGTVKTHLGAIYRKAGVTGRGAFLAFFIEELMNAAPS
ncbi:helix-turn-helix transcriptional regulator [Mameliella sediminis]|uniref:helix-turn-helix transcriptional regulator n=1 Tax=Mameliella sediminis TaxID=2836866 RepID=UPI001C45B63D|nr:helix-turn-helix transcriptional regulator [Mameliella sediminis]MBV7392929.1 helix-turn-helix transcriptional regulator [Mameliella sediminis]MBY6161545.1 helix-turn-helix transcriptional regulator [Mameliella alba]MBY6169989.1 helix-turn-helix transcriptional regulator [Mameliella alba]MBY6175034.1 helix-turn-helix transcriptional regulator [Mameliella alba]